MGALLASGAACALVRSCGVISRALAESKSGSAGRLGLRALVCVYLDGGYDSFKWLVPIDVPRATATTRNARSGIYDSRRLGATAAWRFRAAQDPSSAHDTRPAAAPDAGRRIGRYGINRYCPELQTLFNNQRLAFLATSARWCSLDQGAEYSNNSSRSPSSSSRTTTRPTCGNSAKATPTPSSDGAAGGELCAGPERRQTRSRRCPRASPSGLEPLRGRTGGGALQMSSCGRDPTQGLLHQEARTRLVDALRDTLRRAARARHTTRSTQRVSGTLRARSDWDGPQHAPQGAATQSRSFRGHRRQLAREPAQIVARMI
jgi:hypothetical protein